MCSRPFETRSLPSSLAATHRGFAFYVADPVSSIRPLGLPIYVASVPAAPLYLAHARSARPLPRGVTGHVAVPNGSILAPTLVTLPSMSLIPFAPFDDMMATEQTLKI